MTKDLVYVAMELWGGIFCLITAGGTAVLLRRRGEPRALLLLELCAAAMLFADSAAWYYRGTPGALGILRASNFLSFFFTELSLVPLAFCVYGTARLRKGAAFLAMLAANAAALALIVATLFVPLLYYFDGANFYHRHTGPFVLLSALTLVQLSILGAVLVKNRRRMESRDFASLLLIIALPVATVAVQSAVYGYSLSNIATTVSVIIFFLNTLRTQSVMMERQRAVIQTQGDELRDLQTKIALSQIKPHFLYNALNSVYALCGMDVGKGRAALSDLADYLRGNIDSIGSTAPVPFSRELSHVRTYLALELLRFPRKLRVEYDIRAEGFSLPALTVQPLAENAVKHGICARAEGGTVRISARDTAEAFIVTVEDDGAGFDAAAFDAGAGADDGTAHIGIRNVRVRLALLSGGTLRIDSAPGKGTAAVISLPKARG